MLFMGLGHSCMGRLDRALGIFAEHAVDDTDVEMGVRVEKRAEAMKERDGAYVGAWTGSRARISNAWCEWQ